MSTDKSKTEPPETPKQHDPKTPGKDKATPESDRELTDGELGKVSGGAGRMKWGDVTLKRE